MKNLLLTALLIGACLAFIVIRYFLVLEPAVEPLEVAPKLSQEVENAVWDWETTEHTDPEGFLSDLHERGITTVYADIGEYVDIYEMPYGTTKQFELDEFDSQLIEYVGFAHERGMKVHALAGHPLWANSSHRYITEIILEYVGEFNLANPELAFTGVQFDIEPYSQPDYSLSSAASIYIEYLDTVDQIANQVTDLQDSDSGLATLQLGFAIPYWLDGENEYAEKVVWRGEEKFVFYHLLRRLNAVPHSYVVIMAYRNYAEGLDGVLEHTKAELKYMSTYTPRVRLFIGQETSNVLPKKITCYHLTFRRLKKEVDRMAELLKDQKSFSGFSFNDAATFLELN